MVEDYAEFPVPNVAVVYPETLDLGAVARGEVDCEDCVSLRLPVPTFLEEAEALEDFNGRLGLMADQLDAKTIHQIHRRVQGRDLVELRVTPDLQSRAAALMAASLDMPVVLEPVGIYDLDAMDDYLSYYLHAPNLRAPIHPFAHLGRGIATGGRNTLSKTYHEVLGADFFIDVQSRVSLSPRWAAAGRFFGNVGDHLDDFKASALWQHLEGQPRRVFAEMTACSTCPHYAVCSGFLLAGVTENESCDVWRDAMGRITQAYQAMIDQEGEALAEQIAEGGEDHVS